MTDRTICVGCAEYDDCWMWLVLPGNYCPGRRSATKSLDESSVEDHKIDDASFENGDEGGL